MLKNLDRCKMNTIQYYAFLLTLTTAATLVLCASDSSNPSSEGGEKSQQSLLPFDNAQRVERSPKYGELFN